MAGEASYPDVSPLVGMTADEISLTWQFRLYFHSEAVDELPRTYVAFTKFRFVDRGSVEHVVNIERDPEGAGPALSVLHLRVATASVEEWELRIEFDDGSRLFCAPDPDYEAWEMFSPYLETLVFCPVGGE
jgi:hypothetical protein